MSVNNLATLFLSVILLTIPQYGFSLENQDIKTIESLVKKHDIDKGLKPVQLFQGYAILARELEAYGHHEKAAEYYQKALSSNPADERSLEVATSFLSNLYRRDAKAAKKFYESDYKKYWKSSSSKLKKPLKEFWDGAFKDGVDKKNHKGFYGQYFKDRDIKDLVSKEKFYEAYSLLNPRGLENSNINSQLQYDVLSFINGKKKGFYCEEMLKNFPKSPSVPVEVCRYIKAQPLRFGDINGLLKRADKELPHLSYLVKALINRPKGAK